MNNLTEDQKARYEELKAIGYRNLKGAERAEYEQLVDIIKNNGTAGAGMSTVQPVIKEDKSEETITVKKSAFDEILARLNALESGGAANDPSLSVNSDWQAIEEKARTYVGTIRKVGEKYLIDWKFDRIQFNPKLQEMEQIYKISLLAEKEGAENEAAEMTLATMAKLPREEVKILNIETEKVFKPVGKTRVKHYSFDDYGKTNREGDFVVQKVYGYKRTFTVELKDGRTLTLPESRINA